MVDLTQEEKDGEWELLADYIAIWVGVHLGLFVVLSIVDRCRDTEIFKKLKKTFNLAFYNLKSVEKGVYWLIAFRVTSLVFNIISTACFVIVFSNSRRTPEIDALSLISNIVLAAVLLLKLYLHAEIKSVSAALRWDIIIDTMSLVSSLLAVSDNSVISFEFMRMFLMEEDISRILTVLINLQIIRVSTTNLTVFSRTLRIALLVFAYACFIAIFQGIGDPAFISDSSSEEIRWTLFNSFYFIVITLSSVGYGDFVPVTSITKLLVIVFIVIGVILFSKYIQEIINAIDLASKGRGSFDPRIGERFVLICGDPNFQTIKDFIMELFHEDNSLDGEEQVDRVVILTERMSNEKFQLDLAAFQELTPKFRNKIKALNGSPLNRDDIVRRAKGDNAMACFILSDLSSHELESDDVSNLVRAMAIQRNCVNLENETFLMIRNPKFTSIIPAMHFPLSHCMFSEMVRIKSLALSCVVPGFIPFIYILCVSRSEMDTEGIVSSIPRNIVGEYCKGLSKELYTFELDWNLAYFKDKKRNMLFGDLALQVFEEFGIILLGVSDMGQVSLNPSKFSLSQWAHPYIIAIAEDFDQIEVIGTNPRSRAEPLTPKRQSIDPRGRLISHSLLKFKRPTLSIDQIGFKKKPVFEGPPSTISNHIVLVTKSAFSIPVFVLSLRRRATELKASGDDAHVLRSSSAIVVLCSDVAQNGNPHVPGDWGEVYFVQGSPLDDLSLLQTSMNTASIVVIDSQSSIGRVKDRPESRQNEMLDSEVVFVMNKVNYFLETHCGDLRRNVRVLCAVELEDTVFYLRYDPRKKQQDFLYSPRFAGGEVFSTRLPQLILSKCFFNRSIVSFLNEILFIHERDPIHRGGLLISRPVPSQFHEKSFLVLFQYLMSDPILQLPVALYRMDKATGDRWTIVAPDASCIIEKEDEVLVFSMSWMEDLNDILQSDSFSDDVGMVDMETDDQIIELSVLE